MYKEMIKTINNDFKRILVLQGGGARGKITSSLIRQRELLLGGRICDKVDLIVRNSTGSVQAGFLGFGVSARFIDEMYTSNTNKMFVKTPFLKRLFNRNHPRYQQQARAKFVYDLFKRRFGVVPYFGQTKTNLAITSFNSVSKRTHVFMSWDERHSCQKIIDHRPPYGVIRWSALCATMYFGPINNPRYKYWEDFQVPSPQWSYGRVFKDGGEGMNNSPIRHAVAKRIRMGWRDKPLRILSLGCGEPLLKQDYRKQSGQGLGHQLIDFSSQAREQAAYNQLKITQDVCSGLKDRFVKRISPILDKQLYVLDGVKHIRQYDRIGKSLVTQIPSWFYNDK